MSISFCSCAQQRNTTIGESEVKMKKEQITIYDPNVSMCLSGRGIVRLSFEDGATLEPKELEILFLKVIDTATNDQYLRYTKVTGLSLGDSTWLQFLKLRLAERIKEFEYEVVPEVSLESLPAADFPFVFYLLPYKE